MTTSNIVVATDFSEIAEHATTYAVSLAATLGAKVTLVHAYDVPAYGTPDGVMMPSTELAEQIHQTAQRELDSAVRRFSERGHPVAGELRQGDARDEVSNVAKSVGADLIVVGTHGRRGVKRMLLGSVAESLVRTSSIPVLTVPAAPPT